MPRWVPWLIAGLALAALFSYQRETALEGEVRVLSDFVRDKFIDEAIKACNAAAVRDEHDVQFDRSSLQNALITKQNLALGLQASQMLLWSPPKDPRFECS